MILACYGANFTINYQNSKFKAWKVLSKLQGYPHWVSYGRACTRLKNIYNALVKKNPILLEFSTNYEKVVEYLSIYYETNLFVMDSSIESKCIFHYPNPPVYHWQNGYVLYEEITTQHGISKGHLSFINSIGEFWGSFRKYCIYCSRSFSKCKAKILYIHLYFQSTTTFPFSLNCSCLQLDKNPEV